MDILLLTATFILLMLIGLPIGIALGVSAVITIAMYNLGIEMVGINFSSGIASFPLLAVPFFILAGVILDRAGLAATFN
jgi:C4-dicarboxylate transporter, DctM subunit